MLLWLLVVFYRCVSLYASHFVRRLNISHRVFRCFLTVFINAVCALASGQCDGQHTKHCGIVSKLHSSIFLFSFFFSSFFTVYNCLQSWWWWWWRQQHFGMLLICFSPLRLVQTFDFFQKRSKVNSTTNKCVLNETKIFGYIVCAHNVSNRNDLSTSSYHENTKTVFHLYKGNQKYCNVAFSMLLLLFVILRSLLINNNNNTNCIIFFFWYWRASERKVWIEQNRDGLDGRAQWLSNFIDK